jgi:cupin superfamily acireductone dioxygenase involved in methionine salvage
MKKTELLIAFLVCLQGCALLKPSNVQPMVSMTADECVRIARMYCREDIAIACQTTKDLMPLFVQLLGESRAAYGVCK